MEECVDRICNIIGTTESGITHNRRAAARLISTLLASLIRPTTTIRTVPGVFRRELMAQLVGDIVDIEKIVLRTTRARNPLGLSALATDDAQTSQSTRARA